MPLCTCTTCKKNPLAGFQHSTGFLIPYSKSLPLRPIYHNLAAGQGHEGSEFLPIGPQWKEQLHSGFIIYIYSLTPRWWWRRRICKAREGEVNCRMNKPIGHKFLRPDSSESWRCYWPLRTNHYKLVMFCFLVVRWTSWAQCNQNAPHLSHLDWGWIHRQVKPSLLISLHTKL